MLIRGISHYPERGTKTATVELTYDEIRDIKNALNGSIYGDTNAKWFYLFEIVKNGCLDEWAINHLYNLVNPEEISKDEDDEE